MVTISNGFGGTTEVTAQEAAMFEDYKELMKDPSFEDIMDQADYMVEVAVDIWRKKKSNKQLDPSGIVRIFTK